MKINKYLGFLLLPALVACSESDDLMYHIEEPADTMQITANSELAGYAETSKIVLKEADAAKTAVTFSWGNAADRGPSASITYQFRIDWADNMFSKAQKADMTTNEISYTVEDLNDMLQSWGITPGTEVEVQAQIIATVTDPTLYRKPEYSTITVLVTGYQPTPVPMWIQNSAVDPEYNKWCGAMNKPEMKETIIGKEWTWTGWFEADKPVTLTYDAEGTQEAVTMTAPKDGYFTLTYNKKTNVKKFDICVPWSSCYLVGNALPCGWNLDNPEELVASPEQPELFVWEGEVSEGEIKGYPAKSNWGGDAFMTPVHGTDWDGIDTVVIIPGANPDNKWILSRAGKCRIEMNLNLMKIKFIYQD